MTDEMNNPEGMDRWKRKRKWIFLIPIFIAAAIFVFGSIVMLLWNAIMPNVFTSLHPIDFWQAVGLLILAKIFFHGGGGFRRGWGGRGRCGCGYGWRGRGRYWKEKWMNMSEEERAKMKEEWKKRCESGNC